MGVNSFKDLIVYKKAHKLAMDIFMISKKFPKEEKFSLTDQIRRSSRSVCSNLSEAYRKRQYEAYFISKIADADMENTETQVWLDFSLAFKFIGQADYNELIERSEEIGRLLNHMMHNPSSYRGSMPLIKK